MNLNINPFKCDLVQLQKLMDEINGRATSHTLTAYDIRNNCQLIEKHLQKHGVRKKDRHHFYVRIIGHIPYYGASRNYKGVTNCVFISFTKAGHMRIFRIDKIQASSSDGGITMSDIADPTMKANVISSLYNKFLKIR